MLAVDIYYREKVTKAVGVLFDWEDESADDLLVSYIENVEDYVPGEFYKRELPCILKIIENVDLKKIGAIIIDGYVYIDNNQMSGLGARLYDELNQCTPVIGVAKTSFLKNKATVQELRRGKSNKPLYISSIGLDLTTAVNYINAMKGPYRMPDILKFLDKKTKEE